MLSNLLRAELYRMRHAWFPLVFAVAFLAIALSTLRTEVSSVTQFVWHNDGTYEEIRGSMSQLDAYGCMGSMAVFVSLFTAYLIVGDRSGGFFKGVCQGLGGRWAYPLAVVAIMAAVTVLGAVVGVAAVETSLLVLGVELVRGDPVTVGLWLAHLMLATMMCASVAAFVALACESLTLSAALSLVMAADCSAPLSNIFSDGTAALLGHIAPLSGLAALNDGVPNGALWVVTACATVVLAVWGAFAVMRRKNLS